MSVTSKAHVDRGREIFEKIRSSVHMIEKHNDDLVAARKHVCCNLGGHLHAAICECCGGRCYWDQILKERGSELLEWAPVHLSGQDVPALVAYVESLTAVEVGSSSIVGPSR